jgi:hypothetical protein
VRNARLACGRAFLRTIAFRGKWKWLTLRDQKHARVRREGEINLSLTTPSDGQKRGTTGISRRKQQRRIKLADKVVT